MEASFKDGELNDPYPFQQVLNFDSLLSILTTRLPVSSNMYNMVILNKISGSKETLFYTFQPEEGDPSDFLWIVSFYYRCDLGYRYCLSAPSGAVITEKIKKAFVASSVFKWNEPYYFMSLERKLTPFIIEITAFRFGTSIRVVPTKEYMIEPSEMLKEEDAIWYTYTFKFLPEIINAEYPIRSFPLICSDDGGELTIDALKSGEGAKFIGENWKYSTSRTSEAMEKLLVNRDSVGVYLNGQLVSGVIVNDCGLIGLLYTSKEHRGKGYARIAFQTLMKKLISKGGYPCSSVEIKNYSSIVFHDKIGMKFSHLTDYIQYVHTK